MFLMDTGMLDTAQWVTFRNSSDSMVPSLCRAIATAFARCTTVRGVADLSIGFFGTCGCKSGVGKCPFFLEILNITFKYLLEMKYSLFLLDDVQLGHLPTPVNGGLNGKIIANDQYMI